MDMKVDRGLFDLVSKSYRKRKSSGHSPLLSTAALIVVTVFLLLAGCGDISLNQLLENEEPGEFSISPTNAYVPASGTLDISGQGGFKPYTYVNKGTVGSIDPDTGVFTAPNSVSGGYDTTDIEVTESFGRTASTTVMVFAPISISPAAKTVGETDTVSFSVSGGVPDYDFYVNKNLEGSSSGSWSYAFSTEGSYVVEVIDTFGNTAIAVVTVIGGLAIDLEQNWVVAGTGPNSSTNMTALNEVSPHIFSIVDPQTGDPNVDGYLVDETQVVATFHAPLTETVVTIELEDDNADTVSVEIHVVSAPPAPLALPTSMTVLVNQEVQLTATGGIEPHTFWLVGEGSLSPHPVQEYRIRYLSPSSPTTAYVWVQDALGRQAKTTINVVAGS
jgi:hypothetical protein